MPVMGGDDRRELVAALEAWLANARAGVKCTDDVTPAIIGLLKRASDKP